MLNASIKIFTWFKIPVYVHWSFSLILILFGWYSSQNGMSVVDMGWYLLILLSLFGCVLLHEFGHSLMARRFGVETQDIILTPIGGVARLERMPENPKQELLVAIAGPLVNVVIIAVLFVLCRLFLFQGEVEWWVYKQIVSDILFQNIGHSEVDTVEDSGLNLPTWLLMFPMLTAINIIMVVFNMIPAFPMDGGRVLRALLSMRIHRVKATKIAAILGQIVAVVFVGFGLYSGQYSLAMIGVFVFTTARFETSMVSLESVLSRFNAKDALRPTFTRLNGNDWMQTPIEMMTQTLERNFLVFDFSEQLLGYLDEQSILDAAKNRSLTAPVTRYVQSPAEIVNEKESLRYVHFLLHQGKKCILGVVNEEMKIVGVIDKTGLDNFIKLNTL